MLTREYSIKFGNSNLNRLILASIRETKTSGVVGPQEKIGATVLSTERSLMWNDITKAIDTRIAAQQYEVTMLRLKSKNASLAFRCGPRDT